MRRLAIFRNPAMMIIMALFMISSSSAFAQTEKSESLYRLGIEAYNNKDLKKAEKYFRETWKEDSASNIVKYTRLYNSLDWLNHTLYLLGREEEAYARDAAPEIVPADRSLTVEIDSLYAEAMDYYNEQTSMGLTMAELRFSRIANEMERVLGGDHFQLGNYYMTLSSLYYHRGDAEKALMYARYGDEILSKHQIKNTPYRAFVPLCEAACAGMSNDLEKGREAATRAWEVCRGYMRYVPFQYSETVKMLASICYQSGNEEPVPGYIRTMEEEFQSLPEISRRDCFDILMTLADLKWNYQLTEGLPELVAEGHRILDYYEGRGEEIWWARFKILSIESQIEEQAGKYGSALQLMNTALALVESRPEVEKEAYLQQLISRVRLLALTHQPLQAFEEGRKVEKMKLSGYLSPEEEAGLYQLIAFAASELDKEDQLITWLKKTKETCERRFEVPVNNIYFDVCINLAQIAGGKGDKNEPAATIEYLSKLVEANRGKGDPKEYAVAEGNLKSNASAMLLEQGKRTEAYAMALDAKRALEEADLEVPAYIYRAVLSAVPEDFGMEQSAVLADRMLEAAEKYHNGMFDHIEALVLAGGLHAANGEFEKAKNYLKDARTRILDFSDLHKTPAFNSLLANLVGYLCNVSLGDEAIELIDYMVANYTKRGWQRVCPTCLVYNKLDCLVQMQRKEEAIKLMAHLRTLIDSHENMPKETAWCKLALAEQRLDRIMAASECYENAIALLPPMEEWSSDQWLQMVPYAIILAQMGEQERSNKIYKMFWEKIGDAANMDPSFAALALPSTLFSVQESDGEEAARAYLLKNIEHTKRSKGELSLMTALVYGIATEYDKTTEKGYLIYDNYKDYYTQLRDNPGSLLGAHSTFLLNFSGAAAARGEYDTALEAIDLTKNSYTTKLGDADMVRLYSTYGMLYNSKGENEKGFENYRKAFDLSRNYVLDNFISMTSEERASFWNTNCNFFKAEIPSAAESGGYSPEYAKLVYDSSLFSTSILLASDLTVAEAVQESGNRKVRRLYEDFIAAKQLYESASEAISDEHGMQRAVSMKEEVKRKEKELLAALNDRLGNYNRHLSIGWEDVRNALRPDEAAVEFVEIPVDRYFVYLANVIRAGSEGPELRRLFVRDPKGEQAEDPFRNCYAGDGLTRSLWAPLADLLQGCSSVWFAPQGQLSVTAIESLPGVEGITGRDDTRFRRLTSTRELVRLEQPKKGVGATLYGDIDFSLDAEGMIKAAAKRDYNAREAGGGIGELPGTKEEAEFLHDLLGKTKGFNAKNTTYLNRGAATETSFKRMSGNAPGLLHIGTHGYFATDTDMGSHALFGSTFSGGLSAEDMAMMRSGLLFAGAEGTLYNDRVLPGDVDNGVLTAREIASLKLQGVDLTVLSACETALGEIGADGVFGLQRGLKKAGARSLLMSLWKVNDAATTTLMKSFYHHWLVEGLDKQGALDAAKAEVRNTPGWEHPQFWAPFILLDALD